MISDEGVQEYIGAVRKLAAENPLFRLWQLQQAVQAFVEAAEARSDEIWYTKPEFEAMKKELVP